MESGDAMLDGSVVRNDKGALRVMIVIMSGVVGI